MRSLILSLTLLMPLFVGAQGFGSFSHDQPFLAKDVAAGNGMPSGLEIWLRAEDIPGSADGDPVTAWPDYSGNNHPGSQLDAGTAYRTNNVINGYPAMSTRAANAFFGITNDAVALSRNVPGITTFMVVRIDKTGFLSGIPFVDDGSGVLGLARLSSKGLNLGGGNYKLIFFGKTADADANVDLDVRNATIPTAFWILTFAPVYTNATGSIYTNGTAAFQDQAWGINAGNTADTDASQPAIRISGSSSVAKVDISEFMYWPRPLQSNELYTVHAYLKTKFGL